MTQSSKKSSVNGAYVSLLRTLLRFALTKFQVDICWVKGHSVIGGNIRVDACSKKFASNDLSPVNTTSAPDQITFSARKTCWNFGSSLLSTPLQASNCQC